MKIDIKNIIIEYLNYYPEEKENLSQLIKLVNENLNDTSNLFNRKNFQGHITASGFIYCVSANKLLLLEHKSLNKFLQPGGHVESIDNEIISTAKREVKEETSLHDLNVLSLSNDINIPFDINSHYIPKNDKKSEDEHYHHDFGYLFTVDKLDDIRLDYDESNDYKWVNIKELEHDERFALIVKKIMKIVNKKEINKNMR